MPQTVIINSTDTERLTLVMHRAQLEMMRHDSQPDYMRQTAPVMEALLDLEREVKALLDRFPEEITGRKTEAAVEKSLEGFTRLVPRQEVP